MFPAPTQAIDVLYNPGLPGDRHRMHVALAAAAVIAGCSSGNRPDIAEAGISNICQKALCTPDPNGVCQHTCTPDPGPRLVDCAKAEQNYTFGLGNKIIWTFEDADGAVKHARGMYSYTDNSTTIQTFQEVTQGVLGPKTFEPPTATLPRCSDNPNPNNQTIHIQGGPFLSWGGGVGIGLKNIDGVIGTVATPDLAWRDYSGWEGLSFWARRGPDSQAGFRVLVGDKYTDDDISYLMYRIDPTMPRYCERVRECGCLNHMACAAIPLEFDATGNISNMDIPKACRPAKAHVGDTQSMEFCGAPEVISGLESGTQGGSQCNTCQTTKCDERWPAYPDDCLLPDGSCPADGSMRTGVDRQFFGKPCSPYTQRNGNFGYWCFDPAKGEKPAEPSELCGDHWTRVVNLSDEWQFYTVPFTAMAQQGWAKRSAFLDLTSVSVIRFTWDGGWIDFWIDDVRLYKTKPK
jgi:hypothetical protein